MISVKDSLLLKSRNTRSIKFVSDFVSHPGITFILIGRPAIPLICVFGIYVCTLSFDHLKSPLLKKFFSNLIHTEQITSSSCTIKPKVFAEEANSL